jgi:beta-glucanase (GH16 family)
VSIARAVARAGKPCAGQRPGKPGGGHWDCSFDDEFGGSQLDRTKWLPVKTASIGFHSGSECYVDSDQTVSVSGGSLHLTLLKEPAPLACAAETTPYLSGMVTTNGRFAQANGRFEVRAKLPQGVGLQSALWLYPQALAYGPWPGSGEIDIAEAYGAFPDIVQPHLHYSGPLGLQMAPGGTCVVQHPDTEFHDYAVSWTPSAITFVYDGHTCATIKTWTPQSPQHPPSPFDRPFEINLELALGKTTPNLVSDTLTPFPSSMTVDWVRVWK